MQNQHSARLIEDQVKEELIIQETVEDMKKRTPCDLLKGEGSGWKEDEKIQL
jgi:hypothetical protein